MFGWEFPPHNSGGLGTACFGLTRALSKDAKITFVLPKRVDAGADWLKMCFADLPDVDPLAVAALRRHLRRLDRIGRELAEHVALDDTEVRRDLDVVRVVHEDRVLDRPIRRHTNTRRRRQDRRRQRVEANLGAEEPRAPCVHIS